MLYNTDVDFETLSREIGFEKDTIAELLELYCIEMSEEMLKVQEQLHKQDFEELQRTIHNVKGVSANLYLQAMYKASEEVDARLRTKKYDKMGSHIKYLLEVFDATFQSIQKALEQNKLHSSYGR